MLCFYSWKIRWAKKEAAKVKLAESEAAFRKEVYIKCEEKVDKVNNSNKELKAQIK